MESVLVAVAETTSPAAVNEGFKPLSNGSVSHVETLFNAFVADEQETTKLEAIKAMVGMTCAEFIEQCKKLQDRCDAIDAANGFKPVEGTKKMEERYGLRRRVWNQRQSEAKRLFGVFKQAPDVLKEKGYNAALLAARQWLSDNMKTWDGNTALTKEEKVAKGERKALAKAIGEQVAAGMPLENALEAAKHQVYEDKLTEFVNNLVKTNDGDFLFTACLRIIESADVESIDQAITYLSETKMLILSDTTPKSE